MLFGLILSLTMYRYGQTMAGRDAIRQRGHADIIRLTVWSYVYDNDLDAVDFAEVLELENTLNNASRGPFFPEIRILLIDDWVVIDYEAEEVLLLGVYEEPDKVRIPRPPVPDLTDKRYLAGIEAARRFTLLDN